MLRFLFCFACAVSLLAGGQLSALTAAEGKDSPLLVPNNLALGKPAKASSEESSKGNLAPKAFDGDLGTRWCPNGSATGEWLQVDLEKPETITGVQIDWESAGGHYKYKVEGSADGKEWKQLLDASAGKQASPNVDKFDAKETRYIRVTFLGNPSGGWGSIRELQVHGTEMIKIDPAKLAAKASEALLSEVKIPDNFTATILAGPPEVNYPVFLSASVEGDLYVSIDKNGSLGRNEHAGSILRLRDTNHDGHADEIKKFVADVDSPRGLVWDYDRLYVMHPPHLSVYIDKDHDGIADEEKILIKNCAFDLKGRPADHTSNGVTLGIDGWLYLAIGDFGFMEAEGADGRKLQLRGGGVVRVRTDGSGMELYTRGTRNILEVAVDPLLNGFSRDNTNDGGGWDIRLHHYTGMEDHGYPRRFKNFNEEVIQPLADYGGGSGCGGVFVDEPGFPDGFGHALYTCDWGTSQIYRHPLKANGATFSAEQEVFARVSRVTDMDVDGMGRFYFASWHNGKFAYSDENVGFLARVEPKDYKPTPCPDFDKASTAELVEVLKGDSHRRRMEAQRMLVRKGFDNQTAMGLFEISADSTRPLEVRVAALYCLSLARGKDAIPDLVKLAEIPLIQEFALRAMADWGLDKKDNSAVPTEPFVKCLSSDNPRVRLQAEVDLARLNRTDAAKAITPLLNDTDPVVAHTAVQTLIKLAAIEPCLAIVDQQDASPASRTGALRVLRELHQPRVVAEICRRLEQESDPQRRIGLFAALCRLHFEEGEWTGDSWGTRPDTTGPYYVRAAWEGTPQIYAALKAALNKADGNEAAADLAELNRHKIPLSGGLDKLLAAAAKDERLLPSLAVDLATADEVPASAAPLLAKVATANDSPPAIRADAIVALVKANQPQSLAAMFEGMELFPSNKKKQKQKDEVRAELAVLGSPSLELHINDLAKLAEKTGQKSALWADAALLSLLSKGSPEGQSHAAQLLEAGWQNVARRKQIIQAVALSRQMIYRPQIVEAMTDSDAGVAAAAKATADELNFKKLAFEPEGPHIGELKPEEAIDKAVATPGDLAYGEQLFNRLSCTKCHTSMLGEAPKGPFLGTIAKTYKRNQLAEAIVLPSKTLAQGFVTNQFLMDDGRVITGFVTQESADSVTVRDKDAKEFVLPVDKIEDRQKQTVSVMPEGLVKELTVKELSSLVDFLESLPGRQPQ